MHRAPGFEGDAGRELKMMGSSRRWGPPCRMDKGHPSQVRELQTCRMPESGKVILRIHRALMRQSRYTRRFSGVWCEGFCTRSCPPRRHSGIVISMMRLPPM